MSTTDLDCAVSDNSEHNAVPKVNADFESNKSVEQGIGIEPKSAEQDRGTGNKNEGGNGTEVNESSEPESGPGGIDNAGKAQIASGDGMNNDGKENDIGNLLNVNYENEPIQEGIKLGESMNKLELNPEQEKTGRVDKHREEPAMEDFQREAVAEKKDTLTEGEEITSHVQEDKPGMGASLNDAGTEKQHAPTEGEEIVFHAQRDKPGIEASLDNAGTEKQGTDIEGEGEEIVFHAHGNKPGMEVSLNDAGTKEQGAEGGRVVYHVPEDKTEINASLGDVGTEKQNTPPGGEEIVFHVQGDKPGNNTSSTDSETNKQDIPPEGEKIVFRPQGDDPELGISLNDDAAEKQVGRPDGEGGTASLDGTIRRQVGEDEVPTSGIFSNQSVSGETLGICDDASLNVAASQENHRSYVTNQGDICDKDASINLSDPRIAKVSDVQGVDLSSGDVDTNMTPEPSGTETTVDASNEDEISLGNLNDGAIHKGVDSKSVEPTIHLTDDIANKKFLDGCEVDPVDFSHESRLEFGTDEHIENEATSVTSSDERTPEPAAGVARLLKMSSEEQEVVSDVEVEGEKDLLWTTDDGTPPSSPISAAAAKPQDPPPPHLSLPPPPSYQAAVSMSDVHKNGVPPPVPATTENLTFDEDMLQGLDMDDSDEEDTAQLLDDVDLLPIAPGSEGAGSPAPISESLPENPVNGKTESPPTDETQEVLPDVQGEREGEKESDTVEKPSVVQSSEDDHSNNVVEGNTISQAGESRESTPDPKSQDGSGGGDGHGKPSNFDDDPLSEFFAWLDLIKERFQGKASIQREGVMEASIVRSKTPLKHKTDIQNDCADLKSVVNPVFGAELSSDARLRQMRRKAEDLSVAKEQRRVFMRNSHKSQALAEKFGKYLNSFRMAVKVQGIDGTDEEQIEDEIAYKLASAVFRTKSWDPLFEMYNVDGDSSGVDGKQDPAEEADSCFSAVLNRQIKTRESINGELVRQYLNVVLRGLSASPSLSNLVKRIPSQDVALSYSSSPQCAFALGRVCSNFRRIFCCLNDSLTAPAGATDGENKRKQFDHALIDLCMFMTTLSRCIIWKYPYLMGASVRDVLGDSSKGRIQDSRRGGDIPKATNDAMLVVRTCIEDTIIDPLLDYLFLAYNAFYGETDQDIMMKCVELSSMPVGELMNLLEIPGFFQLEVLNPSSRGVRSSPEDREKPYAATIELLVNVWVVARTPCSKISLLSIAYRSIVDSVVKHYSRPTYQQKSNGQTHLRSAITDKRRLLPSKKDMIGIFHFCIIMSMPPNLETQSRVIFDLGSRHAVAHSEISSHALSLLCMAPQRILSLA
mmetsp:Transcript_41766/g.67066  ORF Transcript_41766/g.67066 Transcript_41766/m.67066 type:complete len:1321 (+) Transcript_41766:141-4103(+)